MWISLASAGAGLIHSGQGRGVFAISLTSLATKENRNGSRQTLLSFLISILEKSLCHRLRKI
jgi:hypothetical protein